MSADVLVIRVFLHEPRFHGRPEWPPAPGRLFQALLAGGSETLEASGVAEAFRWLECCSAPVIGAPRHTLGAESVHAVPNNDLDSVGGDPKEAARLLVMKHVQPRLLQPGVPFIYVWPVHDGRAHAETIVRTAEGLYQFGRGQDMAYARAEILTADDVDDELTKYPGTLHHPSHGGAGNLLSCPTAGTFDSSQRRFEAQGNRFRVEGQQHVFVQAPKAVFRDVGYDAPVQQALFELRKSTEIGRFASVPAQEVYDLVVAVRDAAVAKLVRALGSEGVVEAALVGRRPGETDGVGPADRVRIVALPSIGHEQTDPSIRRILVEVPRSCPLDFDDVQWAFSGLQLSDSAITLVEATELTMLGHYTKRSAVWQTVTPVALSVGRRRIEPDRKNEEEKGGEERGAEEAAASAAVRQALRQAGVRAPLRSVEVQREAFAAKLPRVEEFITPPRFSKHALWHVRVTFHQNVDGPLAIGNGRFLGLGLFAPAQHECRIFAFAFGSLPADLPPSVVTRALRRAILARAQAALGARKSLPEYITGHARDGAPATGHEHLHFVVDHPRDRLLVIDPRTHGGQDALKGAVAGFDMLHVTREVTLALTPAIVDLEFDPLTRPSQSWTSLTWYQVERHRSVGAAAGAVAEDVRAALLRSGHPPPDRIEVVETRSRPGQGLEGRVVLHFGAPIMGPLMLGRSRHLGGGLFVGSQAD